MTHTQTYPCRFASQFFRNLKRCNFLDGEIDRADAETGRRQEFCVTKLDNLPHEK